MNLNDGFFYLILAVFGAIVFIAILMFFIQWVISFRTEYRYVQNEINRTYGREKKYWQRQKRRLLLSIIPFIRYYR